MASPATTAIPAIPASGATISSMLKAMAQLPGVQGCALVETESGMVWHHAGNLPELEHISEAAVEFWRIHQRVSGQLATLGSLHAAAYSFHQHILTMCPCGRAPARVLICVSNKTGMVWSDWNQQVTALRQLIASSAN